jgi:hypothetical protein
MTIRLRFVTCEDPVSDGIRFWTGFEYSHVEAVTPEGLYLGAHADGGVQARRVGYDKATLRAEKFIDLPADDAMTDAFYEQLQKAIGTPYDFGAILGFVSHFDIHQTGRVICSALQTAKLRACGWFPTPLAVPAHEMSPRDLFLAISARIPLAA